MDSLLSNFEKQNYIDHNKNGSLFNFAVPISNYQYSPKLDIIDNIEG